MPAVASPLCNTIEPLPPVLEPVFIVNTPLAPALEAVCTLNAPLPVEDEPLVKETLPPSSPVVSPADTTMRPPSL